ncbi:MAG TPA: transglutaminase family protein [Nocardioidaceae bacterium]|nr:transglutaminase family protein [Nocardioidaceae bacterium]
MTDSTTRHVSATLEGTVSGRTRLELQLALPDLPGLRVDERLSVLLDGDTVEPVEAVTAHGNRVHVVEGAEGRLSVSYTATATGQSEPLQVTEADRILYTRPSRYVDSDRLLGFANKQFGKRTSRSANDLLLDVAAWVGSHLSYLPGSSRPTDGASDTLVMGAGVCRDYAHLVIALLRALDTPARLVAVYAPGCDPMDFHAVTEAAVDGEWRAVDATLLAPRQSLLRISTGRDAADTAFLTNFGGRLTLEQSTVTAVVDGDLPVDDTQAAVLLG